MTVQVPGKWNSKIDLEPGFMAQWVKSLIGKITTHIRVPGIYVLANAHPREQEVIDQVFGSLPRLWKT